MINQPVSDAAEVFRNMRRTLNSVAIKDRKTAAHSIMMERANQLASELVADKFLPPDAKGAAIILADVTSADIAPDTSKVTVAPVDYAAPTKPGVVRLSPGVKQSKTYDL